MDVTIEPLAEKHFEPLYAVFSQVVLETKYLSWITVPPWDESLAFYQSSVANQIPAFVAVRDTTVLGACDIHPVRGDAHCHVGQLGIFLAPPARGQGVGQRLMTQTIDRAHHNGMLRIELTVRVDNVNAIALYQHLGFVIEGRHHQSFLVNDQSIDSYTMAHLVQPDATQ